MIPTETQKESATECKSTDTFQTTKTNDSVRPQRKTVKRETSRQMAGDSNRPLGLLLKRYHL
jgi:hypothetical protein